ncbi:hypothetical protein APHCR_0921 [Anaplasma phagocytophilum str. CR1007]|uniref:Uncharacterized protein n=1 Tax=Anaplasma phagocytophilum str. NCH-1 TaxID=1359161 RepID=A0A0F3NK66_ANAPH|nr:hypothetical protein [Anaplasma phagocytophilum]AGR79761.1 hypothetical protein YYU_06370 [Anaplasma phagocytophilum str. HZ2]AGR81021.1 hypothetical protein WSQ_06430 [Anaplasma phagocytophilum str. JM]AGR82278.1 hypothetical protein YYY_06445 [Anaplasma phagocytophilum str. Dog2]EOA61581.1 hypothetical protein HGE1_06032 [Anaplasma phagocytophilum str. HGE1]KDB55288.1 hypothetical protein O997_06455 [Anaplasma phagocytophilum str. MRK]KJV59897.1 hypothetical protein APHWEB_0564 [Anaplasm
MKLQKPNSYIEDTEKVRYTPQLQQSIFLSKYNSARRPDTYVNEICAVTWCAMLGDTENFATKLN